MDYEHGHTPQSYVADFDAIVIGIRKFADPLHKIQFIGLSLPNIDDTTTVVQWAEYFLNASNHAEGARDALNFIGYHGYPTGEYGRIASKNDLSKFFDYIDSFIDQKAAAVQAVIDQLSPSTKTCLDEMGTMGPLFGGLDDPTYWVASGAYSAYFWVRAATKYGSKITVVGQSQFMDSPDREAGVTLMDWRTGNGTAKYWVTRLLIESVSLGDVFRPTFSSSSVVHAQGFTTADGARRVLLINKQNAPTAVTINGGVSARVVDEVSHQNPPRNVSLVGGVISLGPFSTAVVTLDQP